MSDALWGQINWNTGIWSSVLCDSDCVLRIWLLASTVSNPWTIACQAPLSKGFSREEYWSGFPCPPPGDLPDSGIEPASLMSLAFSGGFFTTSATWEASPQGQENSKEEEIILRGTSTFTRGSVKSELLQPCPTLCDPMDCSPSRSSVHGIFQTRILEWVACPSPGDLPDPGIEPASLMSPSLTGRFFTTSTTWEAQILK